MAKVTKQQRANQNMKEKVWNVFGEMEFRKHKF